MSPNQRRRSQLGYLVSRYWSPSVLWTVDLAVVLVYTAVNISVIRAFRTEFGDEFSVWRHLLIPAVATALIRPAIPVAVTG